MSTGVLPSCATVNDDDAKFCKSCGTSLLALLLACLFLFRFRFSFRARIRPAPNARSEADVGHSRPVTDLPAGHVSVRLIRGQLSNNIQGHPVEIVAARNRWS
jgi:hypothetical protein